MLANLSNTKKMSIINNCGLRMHKLYRPFLPGEAAARGLLEVSLRRLLRKTPTDSSSNPSEALGAAAKASFHNHYY